MGFSSRFQNVRACSYFRILLTDYHYYRGFMDWSDVNKILAVHNPARGVDLYRLDEEKLFLTFRLSFTETTNLTKHVNFAFNDTVLFVGGDNGKVGMWRVNQGKDLTYMSHGSCR